MTPASAKCATARADLGRHTPRDERRALLGHDDVRARLQQQPAEALGGGRGALEPPLRRASRERRAGRRRRRSGCVRVEAGSSRTWVEGAVGLVPLLREVARTTHAETVRLGDDERARPLGPAQPLLARDRVVVEPRASTGIVPTDWAPSTRISSGLRFSSAALARRPEDVREREEPRAGVTAATMRSGSGGATTTRALEAWSGPMSPKCSSVVVTASSSGPRSSPASTMLHPSVVDAVIATCAGSTPTSAPSSRRSTSCSSTMCSKRRADPFLGEPPLLVGDHRVQRRAGERADAPGLEVREPLEHGELRASLLERHGGDSAR